HDPVAGLELRTAEEAARAPHERVREHAVAAQRPAVVLTSEDELSRPPSHQVALKIFPIAYAAGPRRTTHVAGKMRKMSGKSILIGAFCARFSAAARLRFLISTARLRMIWPVETPSCSPWRIERTNVRRFDVSILRVSPSSASFRPRPI